MSYIPKSDTQQNVFLSKHPKYDGRGIKIAIIDDGIDVSLDGLQKTSDGLPKIIDCFDFTGSGNVDTSFIKEKESENVLIGLSGRKLKIPTKWKNPSGKWHLGLKSLYCKPITAKPLEEFPEMDCIVWFDGHKWLACIDTFGDLENAKTLTNFRDEHEYGIFSNLSYCITVHEDGNSLHIYSPYFNNHGSVVAQVAAAYFPDEFESNGLAPGAQIIGMKVLDPREGFITTILAVEKALLKCIEMKVDLINYSIESFTGDEEIESIIGEMVQKHNVLIFKSAGNRGPFYSTVNRIDVYIRYLLFTIGATQTSEIIKHKNNNDNGKNYSPPIVYGFSSRGPDEDGSLGVDFVAPGSVFIDIPKSNSFKSLFLKGTSYSAPNAAGSVACLLSALKANSIQYSPFSIKFALFKTAYLPQNGSKLDYGHGIIQIDAAFDYFKTKMDQISPHLWSLIETQKIYFMQKDENQSIREFVLNFPHLTQFLNDKSAAKWMLKLSPNAEKFTELSEVDSDDSFSVKINTTKLDPGSLNFAEIHVFHPLKPSLEHIFNIPITVIVPLKVSNANNYCSQKEITLDCYNPYHIFIDPDVESSNKWKITITALENVDTKLQINYGTDFDATKVGIAENTFEFSAKNSSHTYLIKNERKQIHEICVQNCSWIGCLSTAKFIIDFDFNYEEEQQDYVSGHGTVKFKDTLIKIVKLQILQKHLKKMVC